MHPPTTGYYSVIQYCPDRGRLEAVNIGVLLYCPERGYLKTRFASRNDRIRRLFGSEVGDLHQVNAMKRMIARRVQAESRDIRHVEDLQRFISRLANEIVLSDPRPVLVEEPEAELAQLFHDLVPQAEEAERPGEALLQRLDQRWRSSTVNHLVQRDVTITVPLIGSSRKVPFAYQNGRRHLIDPHEFHQRQEHNIIRDLLTTAAQGQLIYKHPDPVAGEQKLVVVASFGPAAAPHRHRVREVLHDHHVAFYDESALDELEQQIGQTAH